MIQRDPDQVGVRKEIAPEFCLTHFGPDIVTQLRILIKTKCCLKYPIIHSQHVLFANDRRFFLPLQHVLAVLDCH